jgi:hypothetical protein
MTDRLLAVKTPHEIERIVADEGIDCDFGRIDGYLFVPPGESLNVLYQEMAAAHRAGLADVEIVDRAPLGRLEPGDPPALASGRYDAL